VKRETEAVRSQAQPGENTFDGEGMGAPTDGAGGKVGWEERGMGEDDLVFWGGEAAEVLRLHGTEPR